MPEDLVSERQVRMIRRLARAKAAYRTHRRLYDLDDYAQQGFLAAWEAATAFGGPLHDLQVYVVAKREMMQMDERSHLRKRTLDRFAADRKGWLFTRDADPATPLDVEAALAVLDEVERSVVRAGFWRHLGVREIVRDAGLRIHLVCRANAEAKRKLAARLAAYEPPHDTSIARKYGKRIYDARRTRPYVDRRAEMRERYLRSKAAQGAE